MAPLGHCSWRLASTTVVLLAAAVLWPASQSNHSRSSFQPFGIRLAAGQGLAVSSELLGAGEAATATQLELFEDSLNIATTGGKGRGGRGGSGSLAASAFTDADRLQQLQRGIYYIAAAPKNFTSCQFKYKWRRRRVGDTALRSDCNNFVPSKPRDQKACSTCVSQSVATAMQMAAAAALEQDVDAWEVNAATLYYCTDGGRSCSTGYDIQQNLHEVIDKAPELIRPSNCTKDSKLRDPTNEPNVDWLPVCRNAKQECTAQAQRARPYLKCTYTSLSTFWEIQRWIRNHGSVVTRITIYNDFDVQINKNARNVSGEEWPAYRFNRTAKPLYGHAAIIVGYDNNNFTWTLLNSWGSGNDTDNTRTKGITADGLFKIQMGLAGVGTPDQTYGVSCAPLPGSVADPYGKRQFYNYKTQLPVEFINPAKDRLNLDTPCFKYRLRRNDTVASVVDAFGLLMEDFVLKQMTTQNRGNMVMTDGSAWGFENVTYKLVDTFDAEVLDKILMVADDVFRVKNRAPYQPFIRCWHYDAKGVERSTICDSRTKAIECLQLGNGTVGCALQYANIVVPETLTSAKSGSVVVCNITHPYFAHPRDSQPRALKRLNVLSQDTDYNNYCASGAECGADSITERRVGCNRQNYTTYIWNSPVKTIKVSGSVFFCFKNGVVLDTWGPLNSEDLWNPITIASFTPEVIDAFLNLRFLQAVHVYVDSPNGGALPLQLAGLADMKHLVIRYNCMTGTLPAAWQWQNLATLVVGAVVPDENDIGLDLTLEPVSAGCGIQGSLPATWPRQMKQLRHLYLINNNLRGTLPRSMSSWTALSLAWLNQNKFSGTISDMLNNLRLSTLRLASNELSGGLPSFGNASRPSPIQRHLSDIDFSGNDFTGTLPFNWPSFARMTKIYLSKNKLEGQVPLSWIGFKTLSTLELNDNPKLAGCVPIPPQQLSILHPSFGNTLISGACPTQRLEIEQQQRAALDMLPVVFYPDTDTDAAAWQGYMTQTLRERPTLSSFYGDGKIGSAPSFTFSMQDAAVGEISIAVRFESINGAFCISDITSFPLGVNTTALMSFLPQLPFLRSFWARWLSLFGATLRQQPFPTRLAAVAPASLQVFHLESMNLCCSLPDEWSSWSTIVDLQISGNPLVVGTLPNWGGMKALKSLNLDSNALSGTLPASYGSATWSTNVQFLSLKYNDKLTGTIPGTWSVIKGQIELDGNWDITGCVPDQLWNTARPLETWLRCSDANNTELLALKMLKDIMDKDGRVLTSWKDDPADFKTNASLGAPPGPSPFWCRKWAGVTCDQSNQVAGLDFGGIASNGQSFAGAALDGPFLAALQQLPGLQTLDLAGCSMSGSLPADLSNLANLRNLDLSNNPRVSGTLPTLYAGLSFLQTLDVSGCSISGTLPAEYAALQQLQVFRAANTSITGQLPGSWGLLQNLQVLDLTNARLSGSIPTAWFDSSARAAAARALLPAITATQRGQPSHSPGSSKTSAATIGQTETSQSAIAVLERAATSAATIKPGMVVGLTQLAELRLAGNSLSVNMSDGFELLKNLRVLDLSGNSVGGQLPLKLATLSKLQELRIRSTNVTGRLPDSFARLTELRALDLAKNNMTGTLPDIWVSMTQLRTMDLASNLLSGVLPLLWGRLGGPTHNLQLLVLEDNPCMDATALQRSIEQSGILSNGRARVVFSGTSTRTCTTP